MRFTDARLDRTAAAWTAEFERWSLRRSLDKNSWEAVRLDGDVISEEYMEVTKLGRDKLTAEAHFRTMQHRAAAKAALTAGHNARS